MTHKETMTSRERVIKALNHQTPDRIPIDLGGFQTGIHRVAYADLIKHLGIKDEIQILDPVQISATGMIPAQLKKDFGDKLVFWGGACDSQHILPFATPAQVREDVRKNITAFMPNGGYVFNNVHNIQAGVPAANIVALYDAAYEFGFYK